MLYALEHLGENVPARPANPFYRDMLRGTLEQIAQRLTLTLLDDEVKRRWSPEQMARLEKLLQARSLQRENLSQLAEDLRGADLASLRARLRDDSPAVRDLAIRIIGQKRLPLEGGLIALLHDPQVTGTAHEALVRLSRGTDFGPTPTMSPQQRARSIAQWKHWLALQQSAGAAAVAQAPPRLETIPASSADRPSPDGAAARLWTELVQSRGQQQESALRQLKEGEGPFYTDALAFAITDLSGPIQDTARAALAERLAQLPTKQLRPRLRDVLAEMRRAAAHASAARKDRALVLELIHLLRDPDRAVARAAHAALQELTGRDLGPGTEAAAEDYRKAEADWAAWWKAQSASSK